MEGKTIDPGTAKKERPAKGTLLFYILSETKKKPRAEKAQGKKGKNIDLPVDEFVRTLEIYVSFSTEIVGDDGGVTLTGSKFYEQVCMQNHE